MLLSLWATPSSSNCKLFLLYDALVSGTRLLFHESIPLAPNGATDADDPIDNRGEPTEYINASVNTYFSGKTSRFVPFPKYSETPVFLKRRLKCLSGLLAAAPDIGSNK